MAPKLASRALFVSVCLFLACTSVKAFSGPSFFSKAPARVTEQHEQNQSPPVFTLSAPKKRSFWTRLRASNTFDSGTKGVAVKKRARVLLDPKSGKLTEITSAEVNDGSTGVKPWNMLKNAFYGTADAVKSVSQLGQEKAPSRPVDGYSSTIEKTVLKSSSSSPGERLMKEYQDRALDTETDESTSSLFNSVKAGFYSTVDGISSLVKPQEEKPTKSPLQSFKPVVQPTLASSAQVKDALPDLKSDSPGKRWLAELKIRNWEEEQRRRRRDSERQEAAQAFKEVVYSFGDGIVLFIQSLKEVPAKFNQAAIAVQEFVASVPGMVDNTVETVASIPEKVDETVEKVQTTVETTIETTKQAVEDVQALPGKIQKTVKDTRAGVDETFTNVKVLVGVEEKKPVPPQMPPPKPRTAEELAWDVAGGVANVAARTAWFVTVGAAKLTFAGAELAYDKIVEKVAEERPDIMRSGTAVASTTVVETPTAEAVVKEEKTASTSSFGSFFGGKGKAKATPVSQYETEEAKAEKEALDKEVSDALLLAEKAMAMADEGMDKKKGRKSELDEALQKAREAAVTATTQAVEIDQSGKS